MEEGDTIGPYELVRQLGAGTFGEVWLARHLDLHAHFALKIPTDREYIRQLRREGAIIHSLKHPNIVEIQHIDTRHEPPYLAMEYIDGGNLRSLLSERSALPLEEALDVICQMLEALAAAHAQGVLHRDLKPENILLTSDRTVKVADFGLGRIQEQVVRSLVLSGSLSTADGRSISGTVEYMSPEQRRGEAPEPNDDLNAVGIIACELLTSRRPSHAGVGTEMRRAGIRQDVIDLIERACDSRGFRYQTAGEMLSAVRGRLAAAAEVDEAALTTAAGPPRSQAQRAPEQIQPEHLPREASRPAPTMVRQAPSRALAPVATGPADAVVPGKVVAVGWRSHLAFIIGVVGGVVGLAALAWATGWKKFDGGTAVVGFIVFFVSWALTALGLQALFGAGADPGNKAKFACRACGRVIAWKKGHGRWGNPSADMFSQGGIDAAKAEYVDFFSPEHCERCPHCNVRLKYP